MEKQNNLVEIHKTEDGLFSLIFTDFPDESGGGYEWEKLIIDSSSENNIDISLVEFDSESDMFCAYSRSKKQLQKIASLIETICNDCFPEKEFDDTPIDGLTISADDFMYCTGCECYSNCRCWHYQKEISTVAGNCRLDIIYDYDKKEIRNKDLNIAQQAIDILSDNKQELLNTIFLYYKNKMKEKGGSMPQLNLSASEICEYTSECQGMKISVYGGSGYSFWFTRPVWDPDAVNCMEFVDDKFKFVDLD